MYTLITMAIIHEKPKPDLAELIAGRAWTIAGVSHVKVERALERPESWPKHPAFEATKTLDQQPDEISPRWTEVI
jgi:hypothetical protein